MSLHANKPCSAKRELKHTAFNVNTDSVWRPSRESFFNFQRRGCVNHDWVIQCAHQLLHQLEKEKKVFLGESGQPVHSSPFERTTFSVVYQHVWIAQMKQREIPVIWIFCVMIENWCLLPELMTVCLYSSSDSAGTGCVTSQGFDSWHLPILIVAWHLKRTVDLSAICCWCFWFRFAFKNLGFFLDPDHCRSSDVNCKWI